MTSSRMLLSQQNRQPCVLWVIRIWSFASHYTPPIVLSEIPYRKKSSSRLPTGARPRFSRRTGLIKLRASPSSGSCSAMAIPFLRAAMPGRRMLASPGFIKFIIYTRQTKETSRRVKSRHRHAVGIKLPCTHMHTLPKWKGAQVPAKERIAMHSTRAVQNSSSQKSMRLLR